MQCPCHSGKSYQECCEPFHNGSIAGSALLLMRSRYSAYALCLTDYIISTTHPENSLFQVPFKQIAQSIEQFSKNTQFIDLQIVNFTDSGLKAEVTFKAILKQNNKDVSFKENSLFKKVNNRWLYYSGNITSL